MRINETSLAGLVQSSQELSSRQTSLTQQLASGVRIAALSDDPVSAARSSTLSATLARQDSFLSSASTATSRAQVADTALAAVVTQLTSAVSLAVQGASDTQTPANRQAIATQLAGIRDSILNLANSSYSGNYLFAGSKSTTQPFTLAADGTASYSGDSVTSSIPTVDGGSIATSLPGNTVFSAATSSVFAALQTAIAQLQTGAATDTSSVASLRDSLNTVITQRSSLDSSLSRLSEQTTYIDTQQTNTKTEQSRLLSADATSIATQLSAVEAQQTALLSTLGKLGKSSLFDYL